MFVPHRWFLHAESMASIPLQKVIGPSIFAVLFSLICKGILKNDDIPHIGR